MLHTTVLRPWIRLSFDTVRLSLEVQSSVLGLFQQGRSLMSPLPSRPEAPSRLGSALAGTPYAPEVLQAVSDEIGTTAFDNEAVKPEVGRASKASRSATRRPPQHAKGAAKKAPTRKHATEKAAARRKKTA